ncbi:MAG: hypothetical protein K0R14_2195 [Burkholderiales bacterium]|jgi:osmotically-inducible protein OsmY|nr:hypothetical protein [Burkholderiales bacterium]
MKKILANLFIILGFAVTSTQSIYADEAQTGVNHETTEQSISSGTVTLNVKSALLASKGLDSYKIKVISTTSKKDPRLAVVTLKGTQKSKKLVRQAGNVARGVEGVGEVRNLLKVSKD